MLSDQAEAMQRVCFGTEPSEADLVLLGSRERWLIYRDLVRSRLSHVVGVALRRTKSAVGDDVFGRTVDEWLSAGGPRTRYLRHVPSELAEAAISLWQDTAAPWVLDLARHEIATWQVRHAPPEPRLFEDLAFDRRPVVRSAMSVLRLSFPVHETPTPAAGYEPKETLLCVYRDSAHQPTTRKLNPLAADLLEAWQRGDETIAESVERIAAKHGAEISPGFVEKLSALIAEFVLGAHSPR
jgi:hypothetical protein